MSKEQQKIEGNEELALSEKGCDVNVGDTQASHDGRQVTGMLAVSEDSGHGTDDEEDALNCHALIPFVSQEAKLDVPVLAATSLSIESQQPSTESTAEPLPENKYGNQQYYEPPPQSRNDVYGTTITFARVSEDDFKALNYDIFGYEAPRGQIMDGRQVNWLFSHCRIVTAVIGGKAVLIHARVLARSQVLYNIYNNGSEAAGMNRGVFPEIKLPEFKILMLAIYGINSPILGCQAYAGVDYIKALSLSNTLRCQDCVYDSIADCARGHFSAFKNWKEIPSNGLTQDLHRKQIIDINEAYKAYKTHIRNDRPIAFTDNSFAVLLWQCCPARVYCLYSDILDQELVRQVSNAALQQRDNIHTFSVQETKLFTRPSF